MSAEYQSLLFENKRVDKVKPKPKKEKKKIELGCETCPLNKSHINKVINIDRLKGRKLSVWAQAPGEKESIQGLELVGPAGKFFWKYMNAAGLERKDCDIQNVVRCRPTQRNEYDKRVDRGPTKEELIHCSVHTQKALEKIKAKVFLILGQVAAKQLLGKEFTKKKKIFWSDKLNAKVICIDHPSYFLRGEAPRQRLKEFKKGIQHAAALIHGKDTVSRFATLEKQDYRSVTKVSTMLKLEKEIRAASKKGIITFGDIEGGSINGKPVIVCIGFSTQPGRARTVFLNHPEVQVEKGVEAIVKRILEDKKIKKGFHYGASDTAELKRLLNVKVRGFDWDTNYSEYIAYSNRKTYALGDIAQERFPEFAGYKEIHWPWTDNGKNMNMANVPKKILTLYNSADADISNRAYLTVKNKKHVNPALVKVYTYASHTLYAMERRGPGFDFQHYETVYKIISGRVKKLRNELQMLAGDPEFNPNAPQQVGKVIYGTLGIEKIEIKGQVQHGTDKNVLEVLAAEHKFPRLMIEYRELAKMESTSLISYYNCAKTNGGELRTLWKLTGASSGRMSSGGKDANRKTEDKKYVNLQNIDREPIVRNLLISDKRWRDVAKISPVNINVKRYLDYVVFCAQDYSQMELRVIAHMSNDQNYIKVFESGLDPHAVVGSDLTGRPIEDIVKDEEIRAGIKAIHFSIVYGKKPRGITAAVAADQRKAGKPVTVTLEKITEQFNGYFSKYKGVRKELDRFIESVEKYGYVENMFGFRREILKVKDKSGDAFWENQACNTPVQGGAHQIELLALALLYLKPKTFHTFKNIIMEVHDAVYTPTKLRDLKEHYKQGQELLQETVPKYIEKWFGFKFRVPLVAEAKAGFRMGVMVKYKGGSEEEFLGKWIEENKQVEAKVQKQLVAYSK